MIKSQTTPRRNLLSLALLPALLTVLFAQGALAASDPYVTRGQDLMDEAEYAKAQKAIDKGLARKGLKRDVLVSLYWLEGTCWVSLGKKSRGKSSFLKLLTVNPGFELDPYAPPKVAKVFEETKDAFAAQGGLDAIYAPQLVPVGNTSGGKDVAIQLKIGNLEKLGEIDRVVLHMRRLGTSDFNAVDAQPDDSNAAYTAIIPAYLLSEENERYAMEYFVDALDPSGARLTGVATADLPLSFLVVPKASLEEENPIGGGEVGGKPIWPYLVAGGVGVAVLASVVVVAIALTVPSTGGAKVTVTGE